MAQRVSVIYMNNAYQEAYGTAGWANIPYAADGNISTAATCSMLADMTPATPSSYFLIQYPTSPFGYYSDVPYLRRSKRIYKVEVGYYSNFTFAGLVSQNLTNQVNINNTGYQTVYTRAFVVAPAPVALLTWVDITSISGAPARWTDAHILSLKTRIFMSSAPETADKTNIYNVLTIYDTLLRITWEPIGPPLFHVNF